MVTQTVEQWITKKCRPCEGGLEKLTPTEVGDACSRFPAGD